MLTIFTTPKSFTGKFSIIQENAIFSWRKLHPNIEIILFGQGFGISKIARKYNALYVPDVKTNNHGTPLLSDIFIKAQKMAKFSPLVYINADIILTGDFLESISMVNIKNYFITGRRLNLEVIRHLKFEGSWESGFKKRGKLDQLGALDYFIFPKSLNLQVPPFAVGRGTWDNWLLYRAKYLKVPVIDATEAILAVHQKHNYAHAGGYKKVWFGQEKEENFKLAAEKKRPFNLENADYVLTKNGLARPPVSARRLWRNFQIDPVINPQRAYLTWPFVLAVELTLKAAQKIWQSQ